ncbi:MAG: LamG domain-containing protein [Lacipirellulaceae bacterium]
MKIFSFAAACVAACLFASSANAGLVHHYAFDDLVDGGNATDSVGGATGTWNGDAGANIAVGGFIGAGASQTNDENGGNGEEHYTTSNLSGLDGASAMALSMWFNTNVDTNNNSTYNGLVMTRNLLSSFGGGSENWGIALENNNTPRHIDWRVDGASGTETDNIIGNATDQWRHVVFVWDGVNGARQLYQDGVLIHSEGAQTGTITNGNSWDIGNDTCCGNREFTGTMDDIAFYNRPLNASQVAKLYSGGLAGLNASEAIGVNAPEPSTFALTGLAFAASLVMVRKRK